MEINLTRRQFRRLLDMAYIGNWVLNSTRGDVPSRAFVEGGIHEAIMEYENNVFFDILAEDLARRDMDDVPIDESNYDELTRRIDAYIDEFEAHGTDNITIEGASL